jgi:hypothetical protein
MRILRTFILTVMAVVFSSVLAFASSHGSAQVHTQSGIPLSPLQHGQVLPLYDNYAAIVTLAERTAPALTGTEHAAFTEVLDFTARTYNKAWWFNNAVSSILFGNVLESDTNPGHLPVHAYLRGAYELLARMQQADPLNPAIAGLYDKVNLEMNGMMSLCAYSATPFNTAQIVRADWSQQHLSILAMVLLAIVFIAGALNVAIMHRRNLPLPFPGQRQLA